MSKTRKEEGRTLSLLPCAAKCLSFSPSAASFLRSPREAGTFRCRRRGKRRGAVYLYYPVPRSGFVFFRLRLLLCLHKFVILDTSCLVYSLKSKDSPMLLGKGAGHIPHLLPCGSKRLLVFYISFLINLINTI